MLFTADHGTNCDVLTRFTRGGHQELLRPGFEQQVPSFDFASVLYTHQGEAVNGSVSIPCLALAGGYAQQDLLTGFEGDLGFAHPGNFVAAVLVGGEFDTSNLCMNDGSARSNKGAGQDNQS